MHIKKRIGIALAWILAVLATYIKISYVVGCQTAFFSATSIFLPIIGLSGGLGSAALFLGAKALLRAVWSGVPAIVGTYTFYLPTWCAAWSLRSRNIFVWYAIPVLCMVLFIAHPIGAHAALYSVYWFIPLCVAYFSINNFFARALGATFIAHAVGSVAFLYTNPLTANQWIALIPMVALERITYACAMVVAHYVIQQVSERCAQLLHCSKKYGTSLIPIMAYKD